MNQYLFTLLAFLGGLFLALQGSLNAQLGVLLKNPLLASLVA
ncbi:MAG: DMT family transporter, partial [Aureispira sp.]|nr:DMT family transporter [Aureispira sp.]